MITLHTSKLLNLIITFVFLQITFSTSSSKKTRCQCYSHSLLHSGLWRGSFLGPVILSECLRVVTSSVVADTCSCDVREEILM